MTTQRRDGQKLLSDQEEQLSDEGERWNKGAMASTALDARGR